MDRSIDCLVVLHVTESFGGGTESALRAFVAACPEMKHHVLFCDRSNSRVSSEMSEFESSQIVTSGLLGFSHSYRALVKELRPDVIHLHSSWAGVVGRAFVPRSWPGIVYSPHCFYFERTDISLRRRALARWVERRLAKRRQCLVAVSPYEEHVGNGLGLSTSYVVRNRVRASLPARRRPSVGPPLVITIGRVCPQKDPEFFARVKDYCDSLGLVARWVWIGGGDPYLAKVLESRGIQVTGWLQRDEALELLAEGSVYLHTAAWEADPVSLEEARAMGLPVVVRSIPSLVSLGYGADLRAPVSLGDEVYRVLTHPETEGAATTSTVRHYELEKQARLLREAYRRAAQSGWSH